MLKRFILICVLAHAGLATAQRIAAASDAMPVLEVLIARYNAEGKASAQAIYGSSGKLAAQIVNGAPFELFLSADASVLDRVRAVHPKAPVVDIGRGRLALVAPLGHTACAGLSALPTSSGKVAIAHPDHAPYGDRARETLQRLKVWEPLQQAKRLVLAESVSTALAWTVSGAAEVGIVAWTQAKSLDAQRWCVQKIPAAQHTPLRQQMSRLRDDARTQKLWEALTSPAALATFQQAGLSDD
jgi:molybdate transport system substrate-binding protein